MGYMIASAGWLVGLGIFAALLNLGDTLKDRNASKVLVEKERTKQIEAQLEIKRLELTSPTTER